MATKAELEKELEETKKALSDLKKDATSTTAALKTSVSEKEKLEKELASLKSRKGGELSEERVERLEALSDFLRKLYRESEWPPVKQDIKDWRTLLAKLVAGE